MSTTVITSPVYGTNGTVVTRGSGAQLATSGGPGYTLNGGTLINYSTITGGDAGPGKANFVGLGAGGTGVVLAPQSGGTESVTVNGTFQGYFGGQLLNFGTITGGHQSYFFNMFRSIYGGVGVNVSTGNFLSNSGLIQGTGPGSGVNVQGSALAVNYGTVTGGIAARVDGGTFINAGTLSGSTAVFFTGYGGTLDVFAGAVFNGAITGAGFGNGSKIVFDEPGANTIIGFAGLSNIDQVDVASNWTLEGSSGSAGFTINGGTLITAGTIIGGTDGYGTQSNAVTFSAIAGTLVVEAGAVFEGGVAAQSGGADVLLFGGSAAGTELTGGGLFTGFYNFNTIGIGSAWTVQAAAGDDGVLIGTGIVLSNDGLIEAANGNGAYINGGTIINAGTIAGGAGDDAVRFGSLDGTLVVVAGGVFQGQVAANRAAQDVLIFGGTPSGTFTTDDGSLTGFSDFNLVDVNANWRVQGQAGGYGVRIGAGTILTNAGTIAGSGAAAGVYINGGELITTGEVDGAGSVAVQFGSLSGTLALDANAVFTGGVVANRAAADALIFQGGTAATRQTTGGTFTGFSSFSSYSIGSAWSFYGAAGQVGVQISAGTLVTNAGTITGGAGAAGVYLNGGTLVTSGTITGGAGAAGVYLNGGILVTSGTIIGDSGIAVAFGALAGTLEIQAGFSFSNAVTANSAADDMLRLGGATAAVLQTTNGGLNGFYGFTQLQVGSAWTVNGTAYESGLTLLSGMALLNQGQILAANDALDDGLVMQAGATAVNEGLICAGSSTAARFAGNGIAATMGVGLNLAAGGWLDNEGTVRGGNAGYTGTGGAGAVLGAGARLVNGGRITGGLSGVYTGNSAGTGVVVGQGAVLTNSGLLIGGAGGGRGRGTPSYGPGGIGVQIAAGGNVANSGTISGGVSAADFRIGTGSTTTKIRALAGAGVALAAGGTLLNTGLITGGKGYQWRSAGANGGDGADLAAGASMTNDGRITGGSGSGSASFTAAQMASLPTIIFSGGTGGAGVVLETGASLVNNGSIFGGGASFDYGAPGNGGAGAAIELGAVLINHGLIQGGSKGGGGASSTFVAVSGAGVSIDGGTLINDGVITGGIGAYAVQFGSLAGTLIIEAGAVFNGGIQGNVTVADVLEFSGSASTAFTGFGTSVVNIGTIGFAAGAAWTLAGNTTGFAGDTLSGFGFHDTLDISGLATSLSGTTLVADADGVLTLAEAGGGSIAITFSGGAFEDFVLRDDGQGGTNIAEVIPCFLAGTSIATPDGGKDVADIKRGDLVLTHDGRAVPVRWVGVRVMATRFADPHRALPIRIGAGALGAGLPRRDLLVSPDHAMFLDGILAQAGALVNGSSITRETDLPARFTYYHIEAANHELILAEGAATESFVDNVDRMGFDNWAEHEALYGHEAPLAELDYPRAKSVRQLPLALRRRLAALMAA